MSNFQEFIENVKAGKIEGLVYEDDGNPMIRIAGEWGYLINGNTWTMIPDHLCAHIRRWLTGKGVNWGLYADVLVMDYDHERFDQGSELDWHIDAANWVCKQGVEG
jgi:hypothetical protein